jgi:hypothetical protein
MTLQFMLRSGRLLLAFFLTLQMFSSQSAAQYICQPNGLPITVSGSLISSDALQTGRIVRDGDPSSCTGKTNSLANSTPVRYDSQTFTNPTGQNACVTVDADFNGCNFNTTAITAYSTFNPANPAANVIGDLGFSTIETGSFSFPISAGGSFTIVVHEIDQGAGCPNYSYKISYSTKCRQGGFDLENDGKANLAIFRPATGDWDITGLDTSGIIHTHFGATGDQPTAADYSGDGITDLGVFRPENGVWWRLLSPNNDVSTVRWGINGDVPVAGDYDRDGRADIAVWRPSDGVWYILRSSNSTFQIYHWGSTGDKPVPGDYDGDRLNDLAIYRPDEQGHGVWYALLSNFNYGFYTIQTWGLPTDKPVPADYDGDGKTDFGIYRPSEGNWYILRSSQTGGNPYFFVHWGISEDIPQPADYDGDQKADFAVFRPSSKTWYVLGSTNGFRLKVFGENGDIPVTAAFAAEIP